MKKRKKRGFQISQKIRREIRAYKRIFPQATLNEIRKKFEEKTGRKIGLMTIQKILKERDVIGEKALQKAEEKYIEKAGNELAKIEETKTKILRKVVDLLERRVDSGKIATYNLINLYKVLTPTINLTAELDFTPETLQKYESLQQLLDEAIKQKTAKIKISQTISGTRPQTTSTNEAGTE